MINFKKGRGRDKKKRRRRRVIGIALASTAGGVLAAKGFNKALGDKANQSLNERGVKLINRASRITGQRATGVPLVDASSQGKIRKKLNKAIGLLENKRKRLKAKKLGVTVGGAALAGGVTYVSTREKKKK